MQEAKVYPNYFELKKSKWQLGCFHLDFLLFLPRQLCGLVPFRGLRAGGWSRGGANTCSPVRSPCSWHRPPADT